ncbi:MAG: putative DNA binding domain-containing protein [Chloroflexota bacterium]|nr:putative DNA binding domain-containing protein [Chloroflexota bacterium]
MMLNNITSLARAGESETLEFKETTGTRREATMTVCAFLNQSGGQVLFGVTPNGAVAGQQVSERTIEELSAELRQIDPPTFPTVERVAVDGGREVIVVSTSQGASRPYSYRGAAYRRVGNTTVVMSADEYNRMLFERMHSQQRWENQPAVGWSVDDLDVAEIRRTVSEAVRRGRLEVPVSREPSDLLRGLGLLRDGVLLRAAAVLFGSTERLEFEIPQCLLRVARFRGLDKMEFLDNRQFNGNAFTLLANAERFLRDTLPIAGRFEQDRLDRIDEPLYPPLATREALANALCHRDYSIGGGSVGVAVYDDRLEVTSSGSLHFGLTPEDLFGPHESRPWNPLIARTFYRRGIIEEWGGGTLKMAELTSSAGLPVPEIEDDGGTVTVRFRHGRFVPQPVPSGLSGPAERQGTILALLDSAENGLTRREIRARLGPGVSDRQVRRTLEELRDQGLVVSTNRGPLTRWMRRQTAR